METTDTETAIATAKDVVAAVVQGDLNAANDAFDQVITAKREAGWEVAKADFARTVFDAPAEEPVDTGISGDPAEVEEPAPSEEEEEK